MFPPEDAATPPASGSDGGGGGKPDASHTGTGHNDAATDAGRDAGGTQVDATIDAGPEIDAGQNHAPLAVDFSVQTDEDTAISDELPASDEDGDPISYELVAAPAHGTLVLDEDSGSITYTPAANFNGDDSFTFRASDGMDVSAVATVEIEVLAVNDAPVATGASVDGDEDTAINPLTLSASDVDGDALTYTIVDVPEHGLLSGSASTRIYTPDSNYAGADSFTFRVNDGKVSSATATIAIDLTPHNDPPTLVGEGIDVNEGATATTLAGGATSVLTNDSDVEPGPLTVNTTPMTAPTHGALTLNADGTFSYTHDGSETTTDSFVYAACDGAATPACGTATVNISITLVDDAPIAAADSLTVTEAGTATMLTGNVTSVKANDSDAENEALTVNTTPVTLPAHGTLTLAADGTFSYTHDGSETATDSFSYSVCDVGPTVLCTTGTVTITVTPVNEAPVANDDAIAVNEGAAVAMLTNSDDSVTDNDTDPDNDTLTVTIGTPVSNGTLTLNPNGTFSYTHGGTETTTDSFTYTACDGAQTPLCDTATVSITVTPVNDPPIAVSDAIDTTEGGTTTTLTGGGTDLRANDSDAESQAITVSTTVAVDPTNGSVTLAADGTFSYTHDGSETTTDSFQYTACDATLACSTGTVNVTIAPVNDTPMAVDDAITVVEGGTATMTSGAGASSDLRSNDVDPELEALAVNTTAVTPVLHGMLTLNANGTFSYVHDGSETTTDSFEYEVCDPSNACDIATVAITIVPVNEPPVAGVETITVGEGEIATVLDSTDNSVLDNDTDTDLDLLTATVDTAPTHGTMLLNSDGTFSYTHDGGETIADSFVYKVCDDDVLNPLCTTSAVAITIVPANDAPVAADDTLTVAEGGTSALLDGPFANLLHNDTDADSSTFTVSLFTAALNGTATVNPDGTFSYTHLGGEAAGDSFDYQVCDDSLPAAGCDIGTVTITVTPVNDAPDAFDDTITVAEGATVSALDTLATNVTTNDLDPDNATLAVTLVGPGVTHGLLTLNPDGTFSYAHDGTESTTDSFQYQACDNGPLCDTATVTIAITPVNDNPIAGADAIAIGEGGTATTLVGGGSDLRTNDSDPEGAALSVVLLPVTPPVNGSVTLNANGTFSYVHNGGESISDSFQYSVCDPGSGCATGTVTITITPVNDAPVAGTDSIALNEGGTATTLVPSGTDLRANDTDAENDPLTVLTTLVSTPLHGNATVNANGTFSYTHDGSETTTDSFEYEVCDPSNACGTGVVNVAIVPINEQPVAVADSITVNEGQAVSLLNGGNDSVIDNDTDPDLDGLQATVATPPVNGVLVLALDGTFTYTHNGSETLSDSFVYTLCDDDVMSLCTTGTVSITVNPGNDNPVATGEAFTVAEGGTATTLTGGATSVLANDTDIENGTLSASVSTAPLHAALGGFTLNADGTFSYKHDGSEGTTDSFGYQVCDNGVGPACSLGTVNITVTPVNDAPVAVDDAISVAEGGTSSVLVGAATSVSANDTDAENNTLTVALFGPNPANGTLTLNGDGTFSYVHGGGEASTDGFDYEVCDGPSSCDVGHVSIAITPVNDAPTINPDAITVDEGKTIALLQGGAASVLANDVDVDGTLTVSMVVTQPLHATVGGFTLNPNGTFTYTHDGSETLGDSFQYEACDNGPPAPVCFSALVTITVNPTDDPPTSVIDAATVAEGGTILAAGGPNVLANDSDTENDALIATLVTGPTRASAFNLNADGTFTYTHNGGETSSDTFIYKACEASSTSTCSADTTVTITVTPVDDTPVAVNDAIVVAEGGTATTLSPGGSTDLRANDTDAENNALIVSTVPFEQPTHGNLTLNANGTFSYVHDGSETLTDTFVYVLCESAEPGVCDTARVNITITPVNDPPLGGVYSYGNVVGNTLYTVTTGGPSDSALLLGSGDSDTEGNTVSLTSVDALSTAGGTVTNLGGGRFTYLPPAGFVGADTFKYHIADNGAPIATTDVTVSLTVNGPLIWYVDQSFVGASTGRSSQPFTTLAAADAAPAPIADTRIYVRPGTYTDPVSLVPGEALHGSGDALTVSTTVAFAAGARPQMNVVGTAVTVTAANSVHGLNVSSTGANAIFGAGTSGAMAFSNASLSAPAGSAISLTGSAAIALANLGAISARTGISTTGCSITTVGANTSVSATGGPALDITGGAQNLQFTTLSSINSATLGVKLANVSASGPSALVATSTTVANPVTDGITISGASGAPLFALGTCTVTQAGTGGGAVGDSYAFSNNPGATISLTVAVDPITQNGRGFFALNSGTIVGGAMPATITATGGAAIDLRSTAGNIGGSGHFRFNTLTSTNSNAEGVKLLAPSSAVEVLGPTTITNAAAEGVRTDNGTVDVTFAAVTVNARNNSGVFVNNADNSLVSFGALTIPNPNTRGETALQVTGSNADVSVLRTNITNPSTAIGLLNNTGGSFTLNSAGGAVGDGGTISGCTAAAISAASCDDLSFDDLIITNASNTGTHGIDASSVDGLVLRNSEINKLGNANDEHAVSLSQVTGKVLFQDDLLTNMAKHGLALSNSSGTANVRVMNTDISHNDANTFCAGAPCNGSGISATVTGSAALNLLVDGGLFEFLHVDGMQIAVDGTASVNATIHNNTLTSTGVTGDHAVDFNLIAGTLRYDIDGNTMTAWPGTVLLADANPVGTSTLSYEGTIRNNTIDATPLFANNGIEVLADLVAGTTFTGKVAITSNSVKNVEGRGISSVIRTGSAASILHTRMLGNTIQAVGSQGYFLGAQTGPTACARVGDATRAVAAERNNAIVPIGANAYQFNRTGTSVLQLEGSTSPAVEMPAANTGVTTVGASTVTMVPTGTCLSPTLPTVPAP